MSLLFDNSILIENMAGKLGAVIAKIFIKDWFGISSYLFIIIFIVTGLRLLKIKLLPLIRTIIYSVFGILWISVSMGFIFRRADYTILAGVFGTDSNVWLATAIGKPITALIMIALLASFVIIVFNVSLKFRRKQKNRGRDYSRSY